MSRQVPPRKAILLAAGFGTRMRPLTYDTPKPMMPLWGKPLIGHAIDMLKRWGVQDILVNLHHAPEPTVSYCKEQGSKQCRIQLSFEPEILGTGGALKRAEWFIKDAPFWMLNTDVAADLDPKPLLDAFYKEKALAALWLHPTEGPCTVEMQDDIIVDFASSTPGAKGTYTFCGLQLLSPEIVSYLPSKPFSSVVDAYRAAMQKKHRILGIAVKDAFWADLGSPERYLTAHRDVLAARKRKTSGKRLLPPAQLKLMQNRIPNGVIVTGFAAIGANIKLGRDVALSDSVLWDGCSVKPKSSINNSITGKGTALRGNIEDSTAVLCSTLPKDPILTKALTTLHAEQPARLRSRVSGIAARSTLITLPARGSNRTFERIQTSNSSGILIRYDDAIRAENARYASHAKQLKRHGINVPQVLLDLPAQKATLFEDGGSIALDSIVPTASPQRVTSLYRQTLDQLLKLHGLSRRTTSRMQLEPPFNEKLYKWERDLFVTHFLRGHLRLAESKIRRIQRELAQLSQCLSRAPLVLLHRDMQSSNVLIEGKKLTIIDFQGMRMGPAAYDLASLLCDPYVMLNVNQQANLLEYYLERSAHAESTRDTYHTAAAQRLTQALGAFGRLAATSGTERFANHIQPASTMLLRILDKRDGLPHLKSMLDAYTEPYK